MDQNERRIYLIRQLLAEQPAYADMQIPTEEEAQKRLLRSLVNVRMPAPVTDAYRKVQDAYLQQENAMRGVVTLQDMEELQKDLYLWRGDITRLCVGAIVNAANSGMTGCYQPCHNCIDNCIHTFAGVQLRNECADIMQRQGHAEPTGQAKITLSYNLPCDYVIHTVGPIVQGRLTKEHERLLASCYTACLRIAEENAVNSIAFCCISTGVFLFPNEAAARIAVQTVRKYKMETDSEMKVVFNVFKEEDEQIYRELLGGA